MINVWGTVGGVAGYIPMSALTGGAGQLLGMDATATFAEWKAVTFLANQLAVPAGGVGAPAYTRTGDLTTGFYFPGAGQVAVSILGVLAWLQTATLLSISTNLQLSAKQLQEATAPDVPAVNGVTDLSTLAGNYVQITNAAGAKAITGFAGPVVPAGTTIETKFVITGGTLSLTHDAAAFIILGGASLALQNGDVARWRKISSVAANWEMVGFQRGTSSTSLVTKGDIIVGTSSAGTIVPGIRSVGADGQVLAGDSSNAGGLSYVDSPARPNLLVNPNWQIDQINEGALYTVNAADVRGPDGWSGTSVGAGIFKLRTLVDPDNAALKCLEITCTTINAAPGVADNNRIYTSIEGYDAAALMLGTASAQQITIQFKFKTSVAGTYGLALANSAANRCYVGTIVVADALEHEYVVKLTLDTAGVWLYTNTEGLRLTLCLAAGVNFQTAAGAWGAGSFFTTAAQANFMSNIANIAYLKRIQLVPGNLVQAYRNADIQKELAKAQRYYAKTYSQSIVPGTATALGALAVGGNAAGTFVQTTWSYPVEMRVPPTVTGYSQLGTAGKWSDGTPADQNVTIDQIGTARARFFITVGTLNATSGQATANARIS